MACFMFSILSSALNGRKSMTNAHRTNNIARALSKVSSFVSESSTTSSNG